MTSRVQKGGSIFRPVAKARSRTAGPSDTPSSISRATEAPRDSPTPAPTQQTQSHTQLPPPQTPAPSQPISVDLGKETTTSTPNKPPAIRTNAAPPSIASSSRVSSASGPRAPTIGRSTPVPVASSSRARPSISTAGRSQTPSEPPISATSTQQSQFSQLPNDPMSSEDFQAMLSSSGVEDALQHALAAAAGSTDSSGMPPPPIDPALMNLISQLPLDEIVANVPQQHVSTQDEPAANNGIPTSTAKTPTRQRRTRKSSQNAITDEDDDEDASPPKKRARRKSTDGTTTPKKTTRRRKSIITSDDEVQDQGDEGAEVSVKAKKRKRATSGTPRTRKKRAPSLPPYDPTADPGEQIDPTIVTMASLCEDTGFGRVSSKAMEIQKNHVQWKQQNRKRMADMRAKSERKKYGLKDSDDEEETTKKESQPAEVLTSVDKDAEGVGEEEEPAVVDETGQGFDYSQRLVANRYNAQVRIGPNGETIIDEQSLTIDRDENDATEHYTQITESDTSKFTNSSTYTKRLRGSRWSGDETELFYDALMQYGENYELISMILPGRDRKACKNKFKAEDKRNPTRITFALKNKKPIDMEVLSRLTGKDFSGPVPEIAAPPPPNAAPPGEGDEALHQIKTSSSRPTTPAPQKKRSRKQKDAGDGVEIMGTVDDFLDEDDVLVELDKR